MPGNGSPSGGEHLAVAFARVLRRLGLAVPIGSVIDFSEALGLVGFERRDGVYWAARSTLVRRPEDLGLFDRAFAVFWERRLGPDLDEHGGRAEQGHHRDGRRDDQDDTDPDLAEPSDEPTLQLRFSATETLRNKDFAAYDDDELQLAQGLMSTLRFAGPPRRSYRSRPSKHGREHDLRATVRSSLRAGGEPIRRHWREPGDRLRRLVLLLDVSGSMEPYARGMLTFVHAAVAGRQRVEAFAMGTRLTRVTRELSSRDPGQGSAAGQRARARLERRDAPRRMPDAVQRRMGCPWHGSRRDRRHPLRRLGSRRPRCVGRADAAPQPHRVPHRVGEPAEGHTRIRTAGAWHGSRTALRRLVRRGPFGGGDGRVGCYHLGRTHAPPGPSRRHSRRQCCAAAPHHTRSGHGRSAQCANCWMTSTGGERDGKRVAVARVVDIEGSGPREPGAAMAVNEVGEVAGSVSGGCVEGAVVTEALGVLQGERGPGIVTFGYSDDEAFAVGLTCGGTDPPVHRSARLVTMASTTRCAIASAAQHPPPWPP